jgi:predicted Zn-dependent peptidase
LNEKNISDDLKESFKETIGQASNVIKQIVDNIDSTITDEEIKSETKKIIQDIVDEFENNVSNAGKKLSEALKFTNQEEE